MCHFLVQKFQESCLSYVGTCHIYLENNTRLSEVKKIIQYSKKIYMYLQTVFYSRLNDQSSSLQLHSDWQFNPFKGNGHVMGQFPLYNLFHTIGDLLNIIQSSLRLDKTVAYNMHIYLNRTFLCCIDALYSLIQRPL